MDRRDGMPSYFIILPRTLRAKNALWPSPITRAGNGTGMGMGEGAYSGAVMDARNNVPLFLWIALPP